MSDKPVHCGRSVGSGVSGQQRHLMATSTTSTGLRRPVVMSDAAVLFDGAVLTDAAEDGTEGGKKATAGVDAPAGGVGTVNCPGGLDGTRADVDTPVWSV